MKKRVVISIFLIILVSFVAASVSAFSFFDWVRSNRITGFLTTPGEGSNPIGWGDSCGIPQFEGGFCYEGFECPASYFESYSYSNDCGYFISPNGNPELRACCIPIICGDGYCTTYGLGFSEDRSNCCWDCPCDLTSNEPYCENVNVPHECRGCETNLECIESRGLDFGYCDKLTGMCLRASPPTSGCGEGASSNECSDIYLGMFCTDEWELVPGCDPDGPYNCTCAENYICDARTGLCRHDSTGGEDPACDDGEDNDGDGYIDLEDPGCANDSLKLEETIPCAITDWLPDVLDGNCYGGLKCHDAILTPRCSECPCSEDYICVDDLCVSEVEEIETVELSCYDADGYCETECANGFIDSNNLNLESDCSDLWGENLKCCIPARQSEKESEKTSTCLDDYSTEFGSCSQDKPYYCTSNGNLERDCEICGCPEDQICSEDNKKECLTLPQAAKKLARLSPESKVVIIGVVVILGIATIMFISQYNSNKITKTHRKPKKRRKKKK
ncbi:MAG: hypothetical protein ABH849_00850 [Nanoarchaeota archaeon]